MIVSFYAVIYMRIKRWLNSHTLAVEFFMPEISIIIPVYKVEAYLRRCLDSVLAQTFQDFEVICVNDGSPDGCDKILAEYSAKYKNIQIINQENQGLSVARNNGLKQANGNYIYFLDSDDAIHPQLLETAHTYAERFSADLVALNMKNIMEVSSHLNYLILNAFIIK